METFKTIKSNCEEGPFEISKKIRINNLNRVAIGNININSIMNKFDMLPSMVKDKIDILMVSETKLDSSFPQEQFRIKGYAAPLKYDKTLMVVAFSFLKYFF